MQRLNLYTGGHPFQSDDLQIMQDGIIDVLKGMCIGLGNSNQAYIISGISPAGLGHTAGYIYYNGEVYPVDAVGSLPALFIGAQRYWQIVENTIAPSPVTYQDLTSKIVHVRRRMVQIVATPTPVNSILVSSVVRLNQIQGLTPQGGIIMYSGSTSNFTLTGTYAGLGKSGTQLDGWALCNGKSQFIPGTNTQIVTPDLRGRFIVGLSDTDPDYNIIGDIGGSKMHTLTSQQAGYYANQMYANVGSQTQVPTSQSLTAATPHENRPPYYTLAYIIKLI